MGKIRDLFRWRPSKKRRTAAQISGLQKAQSAEGALETWVHFSAEFVEGGVISGTTTSERRVAWMETTNDLNEGALGGFRKAARDDGNMSLLY